MRKKVYFYSPTPSDSTAFYRTSAVLPYISHPDFELIDVSANEKWTWASIVPCSEFIFQRPFSHEHLQLLTLIKDLGVSIILDYDDNLLSVDQYNPTYQQYQQAIPTIKACVQLADEVWVSTEAIGKSFGYPNTYVIPNSHNNYLYPVADKRPYNYKSKKVSYRGGQSHQADIDSVSEDLVRIVNANMDWQFLFCGDRYTFMERRCGDNYHILPGLPMMQFFKYYFAENSNIAIFPLVDTEFNRGKSNISWLEGIYAGSAFFGNKELPEFNKDGILPFSQLLEVKDNDVLEFYNRVGWELICDTLLLSNINKLRINRILENLK